MFSGGINAAERYKCIKTTGTERTRVQFALTATSVNGKSKMEQIRKHRDVLL